MYPLTRIEDGYLFDTQYGVVYKIGLTDDSAYIAESSFRGFALSLSITVLSGQSAQKDPVVEQTVVSAILLTFNELPDVVINYICSLDDGQEMVRNRLFHWWYLKTGQERFIKLDFEDQKGRVHASALFRRDHPAENEIRESLTDLFTK